MTENTSNEKINSDSNGSNSKSNNSHKRNITSSNEININGQARKKTINNSEFFAPKKTQTNAQISSKTNVMCPICEVLLSVSMMNLHLDSCLQKDKNNHIYDTNDKTDLMNISNYSSSTYNNNNNNNDNDHNNNKYSHNDIIHRKEKSISNDNRNGSSGTYNNNNNNDNKEKSSNNNDNYHDGNNHNYSKSNTNDNSNNHNNINDNNNNDTHEKNDLKNNSIDNDRDNILLDLTPKEHSELPGLWLINDFISEQEEIELISRLENDPTQWHTSSFNGFCLSKTFGYKTQFGPAHIEERIVRTNDINKGECNVPEYLTPFINRLKKFIKKSLKSYKMPNVLLNFQPNECNANCYIRSESHYLTPHYDDRFLSGPILMNLSLQGHSKMTYSKGDSSAIHDIVKVVLPRRCLQLVTGDARYKYKHRINVEDIYDPKRISITFRQAGSLNGSLIRGKIKNSSMFDTSVNNIQKNSANDHSNSIAII